MTSVSLANPPFEPPTPTVSKSPASRFIFPLLQNGIPAVPRTSTLAPNCSRSNRKHTRRRRDHGATPVEQSKVFLSVSCVTTSTVLLNNLPAFEVYATNFKSSDFPTNQIQLLYETSHTNYYEGLTSSFDTFFVPAARYRQRVALPSCLRCRLRLRHADRNAPRCDREAVYRIDARPFPPSMSAASLLTCRSKSCWY